MTLPEPGVVIDLDGLEKIARERVRLYGSKGAPGFYPSVLYFSRAFTPQTVLALIERLRALEGGGGEGDSLSRDPSHTHNAAREADASTLVSDAASPVLRVETAAIRIGEAVFTLPRPNRHHNVIWWLSTLGIQSGKMHDQGFVLSNGQYASRTLAAKLALGNGQVAKLHAPPALFSEDLWDGGADLPSPADIQKLAAGQSRTPPVEREGSREAIPLPSTQPEAEPSGGWKPIESAPKDETVLIAVEAKDTHPWLAGKPARVYPAYIDEDGRLCDCGTLRLELGFGGPGSTFRTTHWRPFPPPPEEPGGEGRSAQSQPIAASNGRPDAQHDDGEGA